MAIRKSFTNSSSVRLALTPPMDTPIDVSKKWWTAS